MNDQHIKIFDTTLRDGQQCPGAGMSFERNIEYAHLARKVGIDIIEVGFPSASQSDFNIVNTIAKDIAAEVDSPIIAGLCQLREAQIDITIDALMPAKKYNKARLHTYLPVDPRLMPASLGKYAEDKEQILNDLHQLIKKAIDAGMEVEFSPEGYSRIGENFDFVTDAIRAAVSAGATIINCPDTIGGACRLQGQDYFVENMKKHAGIIAKEFPEKQVVWSAHCHNDFGLALDNSMNAVFNGPVRQIEGCINGIGERAGNVSLEQCIMYIRHFAEHVDQDNPFYTKIKTESLQLISDFVSAHMLPRQPHWPICGENAARHTSGGHTNAILKNPLAYQPFDPKETGNDISFLFGPLSGGNHAKAIIEKNGYRCDESEKAEIAQFIKGMYAERRKGITDQELMQGYFAYRSPVQLTKIEVASEDEKTLLHLFGKFFEQEGKVELPQNKGDSFLTTLNNAIAKHIQGLTVKNHNSESAGTDIDAASVATIVLANQDNKLFTGVGEDKNIEISALKAMINAVNKAYIELSYRN